MSNRGATRKPARGYGPEEGALMAMETLDFAARVKKNRKRAKLARAARRKNRR